jgi:3-phosphoinositide dependent protein kinase-1
VLLLLPCAVSCRLRITVADFDILERLGDGSFSTVVLARYKGDGQQYAVKIVNKTLILRNKVCQC